MTTLAKDFTLLSPLGISVSCFVLSGFFYVLIGVLTPLFERSQPTGGIIMSRRTDMQLFGRTPESLRSDKGFQDFLSVVLMMIAGLLVLGGIMESGVAWFALRHGEKWAMIALTVGAVAQIPFWLLAFNHYWQRGIHLGLQDMPPFIWVPTLLLIPGLILGWVGIMRLHG